MQKPDETIIRQLYADLIAAWNNHNAESYAALFTDNANLVGFDGSIMNGKADVLSHLSGIFAHHKTAPYIYIIREVRFLSDEVALLRSVVGMLNPTGEDINPAANAIQSLVSVKQNDEWRISLFQNTPAQFHGRPELSQALSDELRKLI
jgi:uncharacterized protein (TIGR02246 family)